MLDASDVAGNKDFCASGAFMLAEESPKANLFKWNLQGFEGSEKIQRKQSRVRETEYGER